MLAFMLKLLAKGRTTVRVVFATWLMQAEGGKKQDGEGDKDSCWCSDWICSQRPMIVVRVWQCRQKMSMRSKARVPSKMLLPKQLSSCHSTKYTKLDACRNTPIKDTRTMEDSTMPAVMASSFGPGPRVGAKVNVVRHADKCAHCGALDGKP